ncbi:UNVERIFIED_CONTAM: hypothetical protein RMT77_016359 [Armadillidium vulgare]
MILSLQITRNITMISRLFIKYLGRYKSQMHTISTEVNLNKSVKDSKSKYSRKTYVPPPISESARPWYEPVIKTGSLVSLIVYFFILREESDIDIRFDSNLDDHVNGLQKRELEICINNYKKQGKDTKHLEMQLKEVEALTKRIKTEHKHQLEALKRRL